MKWPSRTAVLLPILVAAVAGAVLMAGQQTPQTPPTFRSGVDIVTLDVSVFDKDRQPVRGLTAEDFRVTERGAPLRITTFKAIEVADRRAYPASWMREIAPDIVSNTATPDRIVVIVLDDFMVARDPADMNAVRRLGHGLIDELGPADVAAVVYTLNHENGQDFTNDRERLHAAVNRFVSAGQMPQGACPHNECVTTAFRAIAHVLQQAWPGRRKTI